MSDINKLVIAGRLAEEPDLKYSDKGDPVCTFRLANNVGYGNNKRTNFVPCKVYGKQAEFVAKYFSKGSRILIDGEVNFLSGKNDDGTFWNYTFIFVRQTYFMDLKSGNAEGAAQPANSKPSESVGNGNSMPASPSPYEQAYGLDSGPDQEEEIPF